VIDGIQITPLKQITDDRGKVMHMLKADDPSFEQFGEIYFSVINPGAVKAWRLHQKITCNLAVITGTINLVLYDARPDSPTHGDIQEISMGDNNYVRVTIPPCIYNGFEETENAPAIIANCATHPHDPQEILRLGLNDRSIPYTWGKVATY
jgi:dTDP-4-dehydrorhamnose 3,5-epimerase